MMTFIKSVILGLNISLLGALTIAIITDEELDQPKQIVFENFRILSAEPDSTAEKPVLATRNIIDDVDSTPLEVTHLKNRSIKHLDVSFTDSGNSDVSL